MQGQGLEATSAWVPYAMALCSVLLSSAGQVVLKMAVRGRTVGWHLLTEPVLYLGFLLYGLSAVVWLGVLSKLPLVVAYPLVSLNFILVAVGGAWILHERVSWVTAAGLALIMAGIVLTARS
jgi:drug/metabolite transporter (DMT)-like permease